jgi:hypothetical protein
VPKTNVFSNAFEPKAGVPAEVTKGAAVAVPDGRGELPMGVRAGLRRQRSLPPGFRIRKRQLRLPGRAAAGNDHDPPGSIGAAPDVLMVRLNNPEGTFDASFGSSGTLLVDLGQSEVPQAMALQPDGRDHRGRVHSNSNRTKRHLRGAAQQSRGDVRFLLRAKRGTG